MLNRLVYKAINLVRSPTTLNLAHRTGYMEHWNQILPNLYLGNLQGSQDEEFLKGHGIDAGGNRQFVDRALEPLGIVLGGIKVRHRLGQRRAPDGGGGHRRPRADRLRAAAGPARAAEVQREVADDRLDFDALHAMPDDRLIHSFFLNWGNTWRVLWMVREALKSMITVEPSFAGFSRRSTNRNTAGCHDSLIESNSSMPKDAVIWQRPGFGWDVRIVPSAFFPLRHSD